MFLGAKLGEGRNDTDDYWLNMGEAAHPEIYPGFVFNPQTGGKAAFGGAAFNGTALWNAADPWIWYLMFKGGQYVWSGEEDFRVPNFLPRTEAYLTTAGPVFQAAVPFCVERFCLSPYLRTTFNRDGNPFGQTRGEGIQHAGARYGRYIVGVGGDYWNSNGTRGWAVRFDAMARLFRPLHHFAVGLEPSYKTAGPLPGYPDRESFQLLGKFGFEL